MTGHNNYDMAPTPVPVPNDLSKTTLYTEADEKKPLDEDLALALENIAAVRNIPELAEKIQMEAEDADKPEKVDKFDVMNMDLDELGPTWKEMNTCQRTKRVLFTILGVCIALGLLYIFICSLDILTSSFQLLAGRVATDALTNDSILNNPIAGLMVGVLVTVLLQSSSTSTSIIVTMVGAGLIGVEQAIYIIMGANIGTSVTNTIVSLTQSTDKDTFRRSFAGATVHDMFNWLTVLILLPVEVASGYLFHLTHAIVKNINANQSSESEEPQFLKVITEPLTKKIVEVDKDVLKAEAEGTDRAKYPICEYYCDRVYDSYEVVWPLGQENVTFVEGIHDMPWTVEVHLENDTDTMTTNLTWKDLNNQSALCTHLFTGCGGVEGTWCSLSDQAVGGILLACSLFILLLSIFMMVKVLSYILKGPMAKAVRVAINTDFPGKAKFLTGYVTILIGAGITMLVQSSSVFTSSITPLVGMGLISVERMFPLTLGANIGTCLTGILAALASDPNKIQDTLQVSLAHLFFNISGIVLFFPVPFMRHIPIKAAKFMGNTTANYRWFAVAYIIFVFFLIPGAIFGLSMAGWEVLVGVLVPIGAVVIAIAVIKIMQNYCPAKMHPTMRNWKWLPKPLRSLEPYNSVIMRCCYNEGCVKCRKKCCCLEDEEDEHDTVSVSSKGSSKASPSESLVYKIDETVLGDLDVAVEDSYVNPAFSNDILENTSL